MKLKYRILLRSSKYYPQVKNFLGFWCYLRGYRYKGYGGEIVSCLTKENALDILRYRCLDKKEKRSVEVGRGTLIV